jgi:hypothetical protein
MFQPILGHRVTAVHDLLNLCLSGIQEHLDRLGELFFSTWAVMTSSHASLGTSTGPGFQQERLEPAAAGVLVGLLIWVDQW